VNHLSLSLSWRSRTSLEEVVDGRKCVRENQFPRRPKTVNYTPSLFLSLLNLKSNFPTQQENLRESEGHVREKQKEKTEDQRRRERNCNSEGPQKQANKQTNPYVRACVPARGNKSSQSSKEGEGIEEFIPSQFRV
jgi:hypothetical protein